MKKAPKVVGVGILCLSFVGILSACQLGIQPPPISPIPVPIPTANMTTTPAPHISTPPAIPDLTRPVNSGGDSYFAIKDDGRLLGWGRSDSHALGGIEESFSYETPNEIMSSIKYVSGGQWVTLIIDSGDVLWGTGTDHFGQLGDISENVFQPVKIMEDVTCASSSMWHCLAVKKDGSLWCWGMGRNGIPGEETQYDNQQTYAPEKIMDDVVFAMSARDGGYAIKSDNSLWEWGIVSPDLVKIMDDVEYVQHGMAIKLNGDLVVWSYTEDGRRTEPELLLQDVVSCDTSAAVLKDGSLWVWGDNQFGQLGNGTNRAQAVPQKVMDDVAYVATGTQYTLIVKKDGSLWQSGYMDGFSEKYATPYKIGEDIWLPNKLDT